MKLTKIAVSLIVIAGAAIGGGSWYTGKQVETKYQEMVALGNQNLKSLQIYGIEAKINNVKLERGIFSSSVSYQLETKVADESIVFNGNDTLFHGPLPLNRIKQGNFAPVMLSLESALTAPEQYKALFDNKPALNGSTTISYSEEVNGQLKFNPFKSADNLWQVGANDVRFNLDKAGKGQVEIGTERIALNSEASEVVLEMVGSNYRFNITERNPQYELLGAAGDFTWEAKAYTLKPLAKQEGEIEAVSFLNNKAKGSAKFNGSRYESNGDFSGEWEIQKEGKAYKLGKLSGDTFIDVEAKPLEQLIHFISNPKLLDEYNKSGEFSEEQNAELQQVATDLFTKAPKVHLKSFSLENDKGKSSFDLILNLNEFDLKSFKGMEDVLNIFKQSTLAFNVNLPSAEELLKTFSSLEMPESEAAESAKNSIAQFAEEAKGAEFLVTEPSNIKFKLELDNGKVKLNEKELSEAEVQSSLFMLMMAVGSMGL